jgi:hypothetical protein
LTAVKQTNPRQNNMIKSLNFDYSGPIDGHDIHAVIKELKRLQNKIKISSSRLPLKERLETSRRRSSEIPCSKQI